MRRVIGTSALLSLFTPALIALPAAAPPAPHRPHPVSPTVRTLGVPAVRSATGPGHPTAALRPTSTARFDTIGASWDRGASGTVEIRTRAGRTWSAWQALGVTDAGPDNGSKDARTASRRLVSEPVFAGAADGVEARAVRGAVPGLQLTLVDAGTSAADADPTGEATGAGVASAAAAQPTVYTRAQWGADESLRSYNGSGCTTPDYSDTIKVAFVHHTDTPNGYSSAQVPGIIRGMYAYHVKTHGWCDIGYNFLVDRFGRVWEGRYGGIARPVIGAHTGGFNNQSFAASMIGTYGTQAPSAAAVSAIQRLFAWKLALFHAYPNGYATLTSAGGGTSRYAAGVKHSFRVISGHRDAGLTSCPGNALYAKIPGIRTAVRAAMGAGLVLPTVSARSRPYAGSPVVVTAGVLMSQTWRLDVWRAGDGVLVRSVTGSTTTTVRATFDLKDGRGVPLPPSGYRMQLRSSAGTRTAVPWTVPLDISTTATSPLSPGTTASPVASRYTPVAATRVLDTRTGLGSRDGAQQLLSTGRVEVKVLGVGGVPSTGVAAVAVNLTGIAHSGAGSMSAYAADSPRPVLTSLNLQKGQPHTALVVSRVGADGHLSVYNALGASDAMLDVVGYFPVTGGSAYTPVTPKRVLDTRTTSTPFTNTQTRQLQVAGIAGVPADATAVVANVTVIGPTSAGSLTVFPSGATRPAVATLSFGKGEAAENRVVTRLGSGKLSIYALGTRVDVVVDVVGYVGPGVGASYWPLNAPTRVLDTRYALGVSTSAPLPAGTTSLVPVAGRGGIPADATAVVMIVTTTTASANGNVVVWSGRDPRPLVSDVSARPGRSMANLVVVQLDAGSMKAFNASSSMHLIADVVGFLR